MYVCMCTFTSFTDCNDGNCCMNMICNNTYNTDDVCSTGSISRSHY